MSNLPYATIPQCATQLQAEEGHLMSISMPTVSDEISSGLAPAQPSSPIKQNFSISSLLLSSSLHLPHPPSASPRETIRLMSTREPLSLQATTVNFRRFVSKSGPVFWLQDRIEEILMWKKGVKVTLTWMAIYALLCYFPRMFLLLPHVILISILLVNHRSGLQGESHTLVSGKTANATPQQPKEGSADWFANLQAIQNLMGAVSDMYDATLPLLPILTWNTPHTSQLLTVTFVSLLMCAPIVVYIPLRPILLVAGLAPFVITHPVSLRILPNLLHPLNRSLRWRVEHLIDDNNLAKRYWYSDKREVQVWENERWSPSTGWSKSILKVDERKAWTIGHGGWCNIVSYGDGDVRTLTFMLSPGYEFIETENWRLDREGKWAQSGVDDYGWVYTNDFWEQPSSTPLEEWEGQMTRRRRWARRVHCATSP